MTPTSFNSNYKKNIIFFLIAIRFLTPINHINGQTDMFEMAPNLVKEPLSYCEYKSFLTSDSEYPFIKIDSNYSISISTYYSVHKIDLRSPNKSIYINSDSADVNVALIKRSSFIRAKELKGRRGLQLIEFDGVDSSGYLIVSSQGENHSDHYKVSQCNEKIIDPILAEKGVLKLGGSSFNEVENLSKKNLMFNWQRSRIVDLLEFKKTSKNSWIQISVNAKEFSPFLRIYDEYGTFIKSATGEKNSHYASLSFEKSKPVRYLAISAYGDVDLNKAGDYKYRLKIKDRNYNPNGSYFEMFGQLLKDPVVALLIGIFATAFFSYYFYLRAIIKKTLGFEAITDKKIIYDDSNQSSTALQIEGVTTRRCCIYEFEFRNIGNSRIDKSYIKEPLRLELKNIEDIIYLQPVINGPGIRGVTLQEDKSIEVNFDFIDINESILIRAICSIGDDYIQNGGVNYEVQGKIAEVTLKQKNTRDYFVLTFYAFLGVLLIVLAISAWITDMFDLVWPAWFKQIQVFVYTVIYPIFIIIIFINKKLRASMWMFIKLPFLFLKSKITNNK